MQRYKTHQFQWPETTQTILKNIHTPFDRLIFQKNFEIEKNASKVVLAAVLLQQDADNYFHPISYHSRMLNKH